MLPNPIAPPIITILDILLFTSGNFLNNQQIFVVAPVLAHTICPSCFIIMSFMASKGFSLIAYFGEVGNFTPPKPPYPCMCSARCGYPAMRISEPRITGTSCLLRLCNTSNAFLVVLSILVLPAEVETAIKSSLSCLEASTIARVSSRPGSQSSQIGIDFCIVTIIFKA